MKGSSYIELARNYSFVVLLALYLTVSGTLSFLPKMAPLIESRKAFSGYVGLNYIFDDVYTNEADLTNHLEETLDEVGSYDVTLFRTNSASSNANSVVVSYAGGEEWQMEIDDSYYNPTNHPDPEKQLQTIYRRLYHDEPNTDPPDVYSKIESSVLDDKVKVPMLDLEFNSSTANWVLWFLIVGVLVQIRHNARRALFDPDFAVDEPWLLLDGRWGLEKAVAVGWMAAVALAPWIASVCLFAVFTAVVQAKGVPHGAYTKEAIVFGLSVFATAIGAWCSITATAEMLRLRRLRLDKIRAMAEALETKAHG